MRLTRIAIALATATSLAGCGSSAGPKGVPYMVLTSSATLSDTTRAHVADLTLQVRDSSGYTHYKNLTVHIVTDAISGTGGTSAAATLTDKDGNVFTNGQLVTDANGQALAHVQLGTVPGTGDIHLSLLGANSTAIVQVTVLAPPAPAAHSR